MLTFAKKCHFQKSYFNFIFMKKLLFLLTFFSFVIATNAQELSYGFLIGGNLSTMKIGTELSLNSDVDNCRKPLMLGFKEGLFLEYSFLDFLGVQAELSFSELGYRLKLDSETNSEVSAGQMTFHRTISSQGDGKTVINDISLSLLLKCYLFNRHLSVDLGVQPDWVLSTYREESLVKKETITYEGEVMSQTTIETNDASSVQFNSRNLSIIGGATYYINEKLFVSARYMFGMKDNFVKEVGYLKGDEYIIENIDQLSRNRVVQLTLGLRFK